MSPRDLNERIIILMEAIGDTEETTYCSSYSLEISGYAANYLLVPERIHPPGRFRTLTNELREATECLMETVEKQNELITKFLVGVIRTIDA